MANKAEGTLPETNSIFAPENQWLESMSFLLGPGLFSGAMSVSGSVILFILIISYIYWIYPSSQDASGKVKGF